MSYDHFDMVILGDDEDDLAGYSVAAGNLNKSGGDDLTLGGPGADKSLPGPGEIHKWVGCILCNSEGCI